MEIYGTALTIDATTNELSLSLLHCDYIKNKTGVDQILSEYVSNYSLFFL